MVNFPEKHYKAILDEALNLRVRWLMIKQLKAHSQTRVDCMNFFAASFFMYALSSMEEANIMAVGRMMDKKRGVLSFPKLLAEIKSNLIPGIEEAEFKLITERMESLRSTCAPMLERRHKRIAHPTNLVIESDVLVKDWNIAVEDIGAFVCDIGRLYGGFHQAGFDELWYNLEIRRYGDADTLLAFLESTPKWYADLARRNDMPSLRDSRS